MIAKGAKVAAFDPAGMQAAKESINTIECVEDMYAAAKDADAFVIITEWNEFRYLDWEKIKNLLRNPVVVDLRNIYEPSRMKAWGFDYHCVGRSYEQPG